MCKLNQSEQCLKLLREKEDELRQLNQQIQDKLKHIGTRTRKKSENGPKYCRLKSHISSMGHQNRKFEAFLHNKNT